MNTKRKGHNSVKGVLYKYKNGHNSINIYVEIKEWAMTPCKNWYYQYIRKCNNSVQNLTKMLDINQYMYSWMGEYKILSR